MKHTKGPWTVGDGSVRARWDSKTEIQIAALNTTHWSTDPRFDNVELNRSLNNRMREESKANARLIAVAPKLYEAARLAIDCWSSTDIRKRNKALVSLCEALNYVDDK